MLHAGGASAGLPITHVVVCVDLAPDLQEQIELVGVAGLGCLAQLLCEVRGRGSSNSPVAFIENVPCVLPRSSRRARHRGCSLRRGDRVRDRCGPSCRRGISVACDDGPTEDSPVR